MTAMSTAITRQIVLDTETTGMNQIGAHYEGHKIIEIGAVEVINRRLTGNNFHVYLKPDRLVDPEAFGVHGIADEFLLDKPTFADVADEFMDYIRGAELVIHNASFDIGFMDYEFGKLNRGIGKTETFCKITDSLALARKMFPGKRNSLDALCSRYEIDNSKRTLRRAGPRGGLPSHSGRHRLPAGELILPLAPLPGGADCRPQLGFRFTGFHRIERQRNGPFAGDNQLQTAQRWQMGAQQFAAVARPG